MLQETGRKGISLENPLTAGRGFPSQGRQGAKGTLLTQERGGISPEGAGHPHPSRRDARGGGIATPTGCRRRPHRGCRPPGARCWPCSVSSQGVSGPGAVPPWGPGAGLAAAPQPGQKWRRRRRRFENGGGGGSGQSGAAGGVARGRRAQRPLAERAPAVGETEARVPTFPGIAALLRMERPRRTSSPTCGRAALCSEG